MKSTAFLIPLLLAAGCATHKSGKLTDEQMLKVYGDSPSLITGDASTTDSGKLNSGTTNHVNYAQAFSTDLTHGAIALQILQELDQDDKKTARQMLLTLVGLNLGFLPVYQKYAEIDPETMDDAKAYAQDVLTYLMAHRDELDPRRPDLKTALLAIYELSDTNRERQKVLRLMEYLKEEKDGQGK